MSSQILAADRNATCHLRNVCVTAATGPPGVIIGIGAIQTFKKIGRICPDYVSAIAILKILFFF
jgi:hypothetical protein